MGPSDETYAVRQSQSQKIPGLKVLYGLRMPVIKFSDRARIEADFFTGLGVRYKIMRTKEYGIDYLTKECAQITPFSEARITKERFLMPSLHLGIKLGIAWR